MYIFSLWTGKLKRERYVYVCRSSTLFHSTVTHQNTIPNQSYCTLLHTILLILWRFSITVFWDLGHFCVGNTICWIWLFFTLFCTEHFIHQLFTKTMIYKGKSKTSCNFELPTLEMTGWNYFICDVGTLVTNIYLNF